MNIKLTFSLYISLSITVFAQNCYDITIDNFQPSTANNTINWSQFPEFNTPFKIIYGGPIGNTSVENILKKGYTHISNQNYFRYIPEKNRAVVYYNPSDTPTPQPFHLLKSPWGNNLELYKQKWLRDIQSLKSFTDANNEIEVDIFVFDIERQSKSDFDILKLRNEDSTPQEIKALTDLDFVKKYKEDLQKLYATLVSFFKSNGLNSQRSIVSSYADAPILNTFTNIQGFSFDKWTTDPDVLNFIAKDLNNNKPGGEFFNQLEITMPSSYYYYDYPHIFAGEYLSYLLFQIEVNKAWTDKDIIPFVWLRYSFTDEYKEQFIKPWMAEATAIFPFFWGAKGLWLWENPNIPTDNSSLASYDYFNLGLYKLSRFKEYFETDLERIPNISSSELNESKSPIWKGIIKEDKILIAAHNPFAENENAITEILVNYNNWNQTIQLTGYEVHLCEYEIDNITGIEDSKRNLIAYPNPFKEILNLELDIKKPEEYSYSIFDYTGKKILENSIYLEPSIKQLPLNLKSLNSGKYILSLYSKDFKENTHIIKE